MGTLVERRQDEEVESSTAEYGKQGQEGWGTTERLRGLWAYTIRALNGE